MNEKPVKPIRQFRCPYCGYTFLSLDYIAALNRFTEKVALEEDCTACGCVIKTEE